MGRRFCLHPAKDLLHGLVGLAQRKLYQEDERRAPVRGAGEIEEIEL